mmetsp:Transcript_20963/g.49539  ORF Transcript_20963/g.49539 Transcript_20963/m.49539 type:complete len:240 (-) Transcript_20963:259-978(-)
MAARPSTGPPSAGPPASAIPSGRMPPACSTAPRPTRSTWAGSPAPIPGPPPSASATSGSSACWRPPRRRTPGRRRVRPRRRRRPTSSRPPRRPWRMGPTPSTTMPSATPGTRATGSGRRGSIPTTPTTPRSSPPPGSTATPRATSTGSSTSSPTRPSGWRRWFGWRRKYSDRTCWPRWIRETRRLPMPSAMPPPRSRAWTNVDANSSNTTWKAAMSVLAAVLVPMSMPFSRRSILSGRT